MLFKRLKMTNSYRSTDSRSEKKEKRFANRRLRKIAKQTLSKFIEDYIIPLKREVSNRWDWTKDGLSWNKNKNSKDKINRMKNR